MPESRSFAAIQPWRFDAVQARVLGSGSMLGCPGRVLLTQVELERQTLYARGVAGTAHI